MTEYHIVSFSGGKDSTALLLKMIETGMKIDEVINFDTGMEFPDMYEHIDRIREKVEELGIKFIRFQPERGFEYYLLERERVMKTNVICNGWGWPTIHSRWCTTYLKTKTSKDYIEELSKNYDVIQYLGIASDESKRMERKFHQNGNFRYPLVEWDMTEKDCLQYCYKNGYDWNGLYKMFNRVSCWCCPLQRISELYKLWDNFPDLWEKLRKWDEQLKIEYGTGKVPFKSRYSVEQLENRFMIEKRRKKNQSVLDEWTN